MLLVLRATTLALAILASTPIAAQAPDVRESVRGCGKTYTAQHFKPASRKAMRPAKASTKPLRKFIRCARTPQDRRAMRRKLKAWRTWRRLNIWRLRFERLASYDRAWARGISWCESRHNARASNGSHFGAFQFSHPTAWAAGFMTDPRNTSWHEQAVRAVRWRDKAGASQWVCKA